MEIMELSTDEHQLEEKKQDDDLMDRLSVLPEEIPVCIISCLPLKEAGRISILSRQWRHLWRFGRLNFYSKNKPSERYIEWVDRVLKLHQSVKSFEELRVCLDLDEEFAYIINRWLEIGLKTKRVKRLQLDLTPRDLLNRKKRGNNYNLGLEFFISVSTELIKSLTCLCLKFVKVKVEILEFVLSNCPLLETLDVSHSELDESSYEEQIIDLKVCGSTSQRLNLKHLHIILCDKIKSIEVSAPELVSFGFRHHGPNMQLNLKHVPKLRYVTYGACTSDFFFNDLASYVSQLVNLSLKFSGSIDKMMLQCPQLPNLRHLTCDVIVVGSSSSLHLIRLISLTNASPRLQKFKLILKEAKDARIFEFENSEIEWVLDEVEIDHKYFPYEHMRELEIVGFLGAKSDTQLLIYLLKIAFSLDKIVIHSNGAKKFARKLLKEFFYPKRKFDERPSKHEALGQIVKVVIR